ncbi:MAG: cation diffusion facilitator family transporter, partial [Nitrospirota bacterium]
VTAISFLVMLITMAVNIVVALYESRKGRELNSEFLAADAKHTQSDILVSLSVIIGLVFYRLGYHRADAIVGIVIVVLIGKIGFDILRHASDILVDTVRIDTASIEDVVNSVDGVKGCHGIRTRGTASSIFLDLHILVDSSISVEDAHAIADKVESALKAGFHSVADIVVHIEPVE